MCVHIESVYLSNYPNSFQLIYTNLLYIIPMKCTFTRHNSWNPT